MEKAKSTYLAIRGSRWIIGKKRRQLRKITGSTRMGPLKWANNLETGRCLGLQHERLHIVPAEKYQTGVGRHRKLEVCIRRPICLFSNDENWSWGHEMVTTLSRLSSYSCLITIANVSQNQAKKCSVSRSFLMDSRWRVWILKPAV